MIEHYENSVCFPSDYNLAFVLLKVLTEQSDDTIFESRPSEASIKPYERSEFIVVFAFLNPRKQSSKNSPQDRVKRGQNATSEASAIGLFSTAKSLFILLKSF